MWLNKALYSTSFKKRLVLLTSLLITLVLGMPRINMMSRLEANQIYSFTFIDYGYRILNLFFLAAFFMVVNTHSTQIKIGKYSLRFDGFGRRIAVNLILFFVVQAAFLVIYRLQSESHIVFNRNIIGWIVLFNLLVVLLTYLVGLVYEYMTENYWIKLKNEKLQRQQAEAKYENLKNQVNPHFLFNSFYTLNGLIDQSPETAKNFVLNISDVYRYALQMEDKDWATLKEEYHFAMSYLSVLKERFGSALISHVVINEQKLAHRVLPLSLQILLENALKHNHFDKSHPLDIDLRTENGYLLVKNNLQPRPIDHKNSLSLGLYNLNERYKFLSNKEIIIQKTTTDFVVKIPLLP